MFARMNVRALRFPILVSLLAVALAACGKDLQPVPTTVSTATEQPATPSAPTAGDLADRILAAWVGIDRYRSVTTNQSVATPGTDESTTEVIEEVIFPDHRRQVVTTNGVEKSEIVAIGGNIYGRGPSLPGISQPNRNPEVWITINGNVLGADNSFSGFYQSLLLPAQPPYAALDNDERARPAEELGPAEISGQICQQYRLIDTTLTGERVEVTIALAENGLVCSIVTRSEASVTTSLYTYDEPAAIETPASPVPAPAENG